MLSCSKRKTVTGHSEAGFLRSSSTTHPARDNKRKARHLSAYVKRSEGSWVHLDEPSISARFCMKPVSKWRTYIHGAVDDLLSSHNMFCLNASLCCFPCFPG